MRHFAYKTIKWAIASALTLAIPSTAYAQVETNQTLKTQYSFTVKGGQPGGIASCGSGIFTFVGNHAQTLSNKELAELGKIVKSMEISPSGANFMLISFDKNKNRGAAFKMTTADTKIKDFKNKKLGNPIAGIYTRDARRFLLATDKRLNILDARTFEPIDTMPLQFIPTNMAISENGYYLAMTDGAKVAVYNFEEKKPRQTWDFGGAICDIGFNDDNTEFAILTNDGTLTIYDTRNFLIKKELDNLGDSRAFDYNFDGKYVAIVTSPRTIEIVNLIDPEDRDVIDIEKGGITDMKFIPDSYRRTLMAYTVDGGIDVRRMLKLSPYYGKLVAEGAKEMMDEWLKMMPGESMDDYAKRISDENRKNKLREFEDEIATRLAGDQLSMSEVSLGKYDRGQGLLGINLGNMPAIYLPVSEDDVVAFKSGKDLEFRNVKYGVTANDKFEIIYAEVYNPADGKTYIYNNLDRTPLSFLEGDDNVISLEVLQQQRLEEMRLDEIRRKVVEEAKSRNVISDHTSITVSSSVEPDIDANGNRILNYKVRFVYEVEPEFTAEEDFGPGKYKAEDSHAATAMLDIIKKAFDRELGQYLTAGKKSAIKITGSADATPILYGIAYDGSYGDFDDEPVYQNDQLTAITINPKTGIKENEQLAFLRAYGVKDFLDKNVEKLKEMNTDYRYYISVSEDKGSQYRRISTEFTFFDVFD